MNPSFLSWFPACAVLDNECARPVLVKIDDQRTAMLVFTNPDLLHRYRTSANGCIGPAVVFELPPQLLMYIDALGEEVTDVVFDPDESGDHGTTVTYDTINEAILRLVGAR